jgi:hypothetical protein
MPKFNEEQKRELAERLRRGREAKARKAAELAGEMAAEVAARSELTDGESPVEPASPNDLADFERTAIAEGILTLEDILAVRLEAKNKVLLEQRAAAKKRLVDQAVERERRSAGLIPAETEHRKWLDQIVSHTVRLPKQGPRDLPEHRIDGRVFTNGRTYNVSMAQHLSMADTEQRAWHHQAQIMGQSKVYYDELLGSMVAMGGVIRGSGGMA